MRHMPRFILIRPGATSFDQQDRIQGNLDIPLCEEGIAQVAKIVPSILEQPLAAVYAGPCEASLQTAQALADEQGLKVRQLEGLANLDHGLWQGKLRDEVKQSQPKVYKRWQEQPQTVCPPEGETLDDARSRIDLAVGKLLKKYKEGVIALVVQEPVASLVLSRLRGDALGDLWQAERRCGSWEIVDVVPSTTTAS